MEKIRRFRIPISGTLVVEADDSVEAEKAVARWLFSVLRRGGEPAYGAGDLFPHAEPPTDIVIKVDHNHIGPFGEEGYGQLLKEAETYEKKKLAKVLPAKERKLVMNPTDQEVGA